eukprot:gene27672-33420_t
MEVESPVSVNLSPSMLAPDAMKVLPPVRVPSTSQLLSAKHVHRKSSKHLLSPLIKQTSQFESFRANLLCSSLDDNHVLENTSSKQLMKDERDNCLDSDVNNSRISKRINAIMRKVHSFRADSTDLKLMFVDETHSYPSTYSTQQLPGMVHYPAPSSSLSPPRSRFDAPLSTSAPKGPHMTIHASVEYLKKSLIRRKSFTDDDIIGLYNQPYHSRQQSNVYLDRHGIAPDHSLEDTFEGVPAMLSTHGNRSTSNRSISTKSSNSHRSIQSASSLDTVDRKLQERRLKKQQIAEVDATPINPYKTLVTPSRRLEILGKQVSQRLQITSTQEVNYNQGIAADSDNTNMRDTDSKAHTKQLMRQRSVGALKRASPNRLALAPPTLSDGTAKNTTIRSYFGKKM